MAKSEQDVNKKYQIFIREYLVDRNATRAAIAAGYKQKTARQAGYRLLTNVDIQAEIAKRAEKVLAKLDVTAEKVLRGLAELAFFDPRKMFRSDGALKPIIEFDDISAMALAGIEVQATERIEEKLADGATAKNDKADEPLVTRKIVTSKIRLANRGENLERLGRYFKLFNEKDPTVRNPQLNADPEQRIAEIFALAESRAGRVSKPN